MPNRNLVENCHSDPGAILAETEAVKNRRHVATKPELSKRGQGFAGGVRQSSFVSSSPGGKVMSYEIILIAVIAERGRHSDTVIEQQRNNKRTAAMFVLQLPRMQHTGGVQV